MIKKSAIKSAFESLCRTMIVYTPFGAYTATCISIRIISVGKSFAVALYKGFDFNGVSEDWVVARSYPMSYKSAYQLVCSM